MRIRKSIHFGPAHDCVENQPCKWGSERCTPGGGGNHGIGCVMMSFVLRGPKGAVSFEMFTGWYLPETHKRFSKKLERMAGVIDYHYATEPPAHLGHHEKCSFSGAGECWPDVSFFDGDNAYDALTRYGEGKGGIWDFLKLRYSQQIETTP